MEDSVNKGSIFAAICLGSLVASAQSYDYGKYGKSSESIFTPGFHWLQNRGSDFCDIFHFGIGMTHENPVTGPLTPSMGVHAQVTDYGHLGYVVFAGGSVEMEGRGFGVYPEFREIGGFGPWKTWAVSQDSDIVSFYKDPKRSRGWSARMDGSESFNDDSAHVVIHKDADSMSTTWNHHPRGWHNFAYTGLEVALPVGIPYTPLDTHLGVTVRAGVDTSQVADFLLGWFGLDFWHDDLRPSDLATSARGTR